MRGRTNVGTLGVGGTGKGGISGGYSITVPLSAWALVGSEYQSHVSDSNVSADTDAKGYKVNIDWGNSSMPNLTSWMNTSTDAETGGGYTISTGALPFGDLSGEVTIIEVKRI